MTTLKEPLRFERRLLEKVWGGRALARNPGFELPPGAKVGETWEIVDREEENSIVAEGGFAGTSLGELMARHGGDLVGRPSLVRKRRFPLLVKYIDAADNLSVQVHPDDEKAGLLGDGAEGKSEAWYILDVAPGGALYCGLKPGVVAGEFARVATTPRVIDLLQKWSVRPGDCILVPGGTVHAIGAGVTLLEVQQNSDTTFRIWDWGRPRDTHVPQALRCVRFGSPVEPPRSASWSSAPLASERAPLARARHFGMDAVRVARPSRFELGGSFRILALIEGEGRLLAGEGEPRTMRRGDVWLVPASCDSFSIEPLAGAVQVVEMRGGEEA